MKDDIRKLRDLFNESDSSDVIYGTPSHLVIRWKDASAGEFMRALIKLFGAIDEETA